MGGNAFKDIERIKRTNINPTLMDFCNHIGMSENLEKFIENLLGSCGKQDDSGDIDVGIDWSDENIFSQLCDKCVKYDVSHQLRPRHLMVKWPIANQIGYIQIDFILGNLNWIRFTHNSPGLDVSPFKGLYIQSLIGIVAKTKLQYRLFIDSTEVANHGWIYDTTNGLTRIWRLYENNHMSSVDADYWEQRLPSKYIPRFQRCGFIDNPYEVCRILFNSTPDVCDTFESLWKHIITTGISSKSSILPRLVDKIMLTPEKKTKTREDVFNFIDAIEA
ncbi:MAG: hypothetical protein WC284_10210 [Candidimonas sp.]